MKEMIYLLLCLLRHCKVLPFGFGGLFCGVAKPSPKVNCGTTNTRQILLSETVIYLDLWISFERRMECSKCFYGI